MHLGHANLMDCAREIYGFLQGGCCGGLVGFRPDVTSVDLSHLSISYLRLVKQWEGRVLEPGSCWLALVTIAGYDGFPSRFVGGWPVKPGEFVVAISQLTTYCLPEQ